MRKRSVFLLAASLLGAQSAAADETISYTYDALGRLVGTSHAGDVNDGVITSIQYDNAGNRTEYQISGSKPQQPTLVVLPLNGITVISIER